MTAEPTQEWFEMTELRKRRIANSAWIPLRSVERLSKQGDFKQPGSFEEIFFVGSVAIPLGKRKDAERLEWNDIGIGHAGGPYAFRDGSYKPCEIYQYRDGEDLGIDLVIEQHIGSGHPNIWHVNQDLILALRLIQEGDNWLRPEENYDRALRQRRDSDGKVIAIEMRSDFLRDYLAARGLALRLSYYRQRFFIYSSAPNFNWPKGGKDEDQPHDRFKTRLYEIDADGGPYGGGVAVFKIWRTDVDADEDVPVFGREGAENTDGRSFSYTRSGPKFYRAEGELWREEWIEPAELSERVRGDSSKEEIFFIVDGAGKRAPSSSLDNEDIGRYLWFEPSVIARLSGRRGGDLSWYTAETGSVSCSPDYPVHFGINRIGLVTVYAYDIAKLPRWQQLLWAASNVTPDGQVAGELLDAQMRAQPASTTAPEDELISSIRELDKKFHERFGSPLFKEHTAEIEIVKNVHRFRALDKGGLFALAKDITRLMADRIDINPLRKVISPPNGEKWGSLKSLEKVIGTCVSAEQARAALTPLVGAYELRLGDAHLPGSDINEAFQMAGVSSDAHAVEQGRQLLSSAVDGIREIIKALASPTVAS